MPRNLVLWPIVIFMVGAAILDDILLRRSLDVRRTHPDPIDAPGEKSRNQPDRARFFGSDGNNERILGVLQSLYAFGKTGGLRALVTPSAGFPETAD